MPDVPPWLSVVLVAVLAARYGPLLRLEIRIRWHQIKLRRLEAELRAAVQEAAAIDDQIDAWIATFPEEEREEVRAWIEQWESR